ncbi:ROK family protein [Devosia sp. PTR5]|uniref:ROK family protein n=1 Tax=Devosia oryzisoli TaxID=2774138 RepID=A0A927ITC1_9HYPH|nr:ROK family protein [Devosia oryzisoli]MBD8065658.1 ROK family protein [Devosia oryzisoli]
MMTCFDIGGSTIKAATADPTHPTDLAPLGRVKTPLDDLEAFCTAIERQVLAGGASASAPLAISVTGVVDPVSQVVTCANIPCIDGLALAPHLEHRLRRLVFVANDADCFVLAEALAGAGRGYRVVFGAILGTGVGGGIVVDGRLHAGAGGLAGEWGHGPIAATSVGTPPLSIPRLSCGCGQVGCVDTIGGARGLERIHLHIWGKHTASTEIIAGWLAGGEQEARSVEVQIELMADPLALVVNIIGPDVIPVGGGLGTVRPLVERLDHAVRQRILRRLDRPLVVPAGLQGDPGLVGAALLARVT